MSESHAVRTSASRKRLQSTVGSSQTTGPAFKPRAASAWVSSVSSGVHSGKVGAVTRAMSGGFARLGTGGMLPRATRPGREARAVSTVSVHEGLGRTEEVHLLVLELALELGTHLQDLPHRLHAGDGAHLERRRPTRGDGRLERNHAFQPLDLSQDGRVQAEAQGAGGAGGDVIQPL